MSFAQAVVSGTVAAAVDTAAFSALFLGLNVLVGLVSARVSPTYRALPDLVEQTDWTAAWVSIFHATWSSSLTVPMFFGAARFAGQWGLDDAMPPDATLAARLFFAFHLADFPIVVLIVLRATTRKARLEGWVYMVHHSLVVAVWGGVFLAGRCAPFALVGMVCELTSVFVNVRKLLHLTGRGSGALYVLNGIVLLLAWYATRVAAYFGFGVLLVWKHAAPLRARGLEGALTVGSWAVGGALQLQWTYRLTLGAIRLFTGKTPKSKAR